MGDVLMKRRRMTSAEVGSLKKAMVVVVVVVVEVKVTCCRFLWTPIVIFVRRFGI
jgi:hypothetical protein